jgi:hypothetical protein
VGDAERATTWQDQVIATRPSGIDRVQLERFRALSPTERLESMRRLLADILEAAQAGNEPRDRARLPNAG